MLFLIIFLMIVASLIFVLLRRAKLEEQYNQTQTITVDLEELITTEKDEDFELFVLSYLMDFSSETNKAELDILDLINSRMEYLKNLHQNEMDLYFKDNQKISDHMLSIAEFLKKSNKHRTRKYFKKHSKKLVDFIEYLCSIEKPLVLLYTPFNCNSSIHSEYSYFDVLTNLLFVEAYPHLSPENKSYIDTLYTNIAVTIYVSREHLSKASSISSQITELQKFKKQNQTLIDSRMR